MKTTMQYDTYDSECIILMYLCFEANYVAKVVLVTVDHSRSSTGAATCAVKSAPMSPTKKLKIKHNEPNAMLT